MHGNEWWERRFSAATALCKVMNGMSAKKTFIKAIKSSIVHWILLAFQSIFLLVHHESLKSHSWIIFSFHTKEFFIKFKCLHFYSHCVKRKLFSVFFTLDYSVCFCCVAFSSFILSTKKIVWSKALQLHFSLPLSNWLWSFSIIG